MNQQIEQPTTITTNITTNKFFTYISPAKLNLGLQVIGKRADGYHLLNTTFCLIDLFDEISIQVTHNNKISLLDHNQAWFYQKDLAYKAGIYLQNHTQTKLGANIKVKKTIPAGSGLGGGSSNAATVLIALNQLWQTNLTKKELMEIGKRLGADVPFFIYGKNAIATGIGDIFTETDIPEQYFVLVIPSFHLATKDVFAQYNIEQNTSNKFQQIQPPQFINDLQNSAITLQPELGNIISDLEKYGYVSMTGSGSAVYLTFFDKNIA